MADDDATGSLEAQRWRELAQALEDAQKALTSPQAQPAPQGEDDAA
jgi:sialic acid synthase SpsE